ncbi:hypothetical protein NLI96_g6197 [Meripilus lineatus]|uniref:Uncharacterized protein n=1 Tax=Meripilus lineatus TaxID=2056292 RepID=A0AAD5YG61_9APHY|nr:hypothetical protein NLI96_g6197 [Physisporinus lineatus]
MKSNTSEAGDSNVDASPAIVLTTPHCFAMEELPNAGEERARLQADPSLASSSTLYFHLSRGLAYTTGSALGSTPPPQAACLSAFVFPNKVGLTAGARAWSKHAHRSGGVDDPPTADAEGDRSTEKKKKKKAVVPSGWWGTPSGPVAIINERALELFWRVTNAASWRNLHWLPHCVLVYEMRVPEGYGMRWSQDQTGFVEPGSGKIIEGKDEDLKERPWIFRGFVEPMMENGHEVGWRH